MAALLMLGGPALACSLCGADSLKRQSLRQDAQKAKHVYYGTLSNPRLNAVNASGAANSSATDFTVIQVLKAETAARRTQKQLTIPKYIPIDVAAPPKFLIFCDELDGKLDPYRGIPVESPAPVEYLRGAAAIDPKDIAATLNYAGRFLDSSDKDVSGDAFLEFARSNDRDVLAAAKKLDPAKLRKLLDDPKTPPERLGLFTYMLGACGTKDDAAKLRGIVQAPGDRFRGAIGGAYAGLIMLEPQEGWRTLLATLADAKRPFPDRNSALSALRFYHNANLTTFRAEVLQGLKSLLPQEDIADLAVEDLRRWKLWDLTPEVLELYGRKSHDAPLMRRAVVRYALCVPGEPAKSFISRVRAATPEVVKDVEESLQYERGVVQP